MIGRALKYKPMKLSYPKFLLALSFAFFVALVDFSRAEEKPTNTVYSVKPPAAMENVKYGPNERNVLDLWKAKSENPTPLVVFIHGGGFRSGDKAQLDEDFLNRCLESGISVAAINYRLSKTSPYPAPMMDGARAVQFIRSKAAEWNINPEKIGATGGSAGGGISLWIGFHDDLADPKSADPVLRESSRLKCMAVKAAQTSYDPRYIKTLIGGHVHEDPALIKLFSLKTNELNSAKAFKLYEEASPINLVTADDPSVFLFYPEANKPLPKNAPPGQGIHHPKYGEALKKKMDALKIECVLRLKEDYKTKGGNANSEMLSFFLKHFDLKKTTPTPPK